MSHLQDTDKSGPSHTRARQLDDLHTTIQLLRDSKDRVESEFGKGLLSALATILLLVQGSSQNIEELEDVLTRCNEVASEVVKTEQPDGRQIEEDESMLQASLDLTSLVNELHASLERKIQQSRVIAIVSASLHSKEIMDWEERLDHFLNVFRVESSLSSSTPSQVAESQILLQDDTPSLARSEFEDHTGPGYHIPAMPFIFFGRDAVVQETASRVLKRQHVALIGPGGIGKSSISKAIMHDERIVSYFGVRRCFVTYDGVDYSMMNRETFLSRLASALALGGSPTLPSILWAVRVSPILLVIDNAEVFLQAGTKDVGPIKDTIADLGGSPSVHLVLITRSFNLPHLPLPFFYQNVRGLDVEASRATFTAIYKHNIGNRLDTLFSSLDFHPLSISLLSQVATQNAYRTTEEIEQAWKQQQTRLLKTGEGRLENLAESIRLSIDSPNMWFMKATVIRLLRIVSFLPDGLHRQDLSEIFSDSPDITTVVNAASMVSLVYWSGDRLTSFAPIRLHIMDQYNANLSYKDPFLLFIRDYFYHKLSSNSSSWIIREGSNIERLLSFDLSAVHVEQDFKARLRTLKSVDEWLIASYKYHPRETGLFPLLEPLSKERPIFQVGGVIVGKRTSKGLAIAKAECLIGICWLQYKLSRDFLGNGMLDIAESFCRTHMPICRAQLLNCLKLKSISYYEDSNFSLADETLREATSIARSMNNRLYEALLSDTFSSILFHRGNLLEATSLMASAEEYFRSNAKHRHLSNVLEQRISIALHLRDFNTARDILEQTEEIDRVHNDSRRSRNLLNWKADIEAQAGNVVAAVELLDEATKAGLGRDPRRLDFDDYVASWRAKAYYAATLGHLDDARQFIAHAINLTSKAGSSDGLDGLVAAYIELYSSDLETAGRWFEMMLEEDDQANIQFTGFLWRALGEIALLQSREDEAVTRFSKVKSMCDSSGMSPKLLYAGVFHWYTLSVEYTGWTRFLDGTL